MIAPIIEDLLLEEKEKLFLPAEKVAVLYEENMLDHALLVLLNVGYAVIPVLNKEGKLTGLISIPRIIKKQQSADVIRYDTLHEQLVRDAMDTDFPTVKKTTQVEDVLNLLVDRNFLCIVDDEGSFKGIITRKEMLKRVNYMVHQMSKNL